MKVSYQATSIQKPVLDCLCPLRDCLLFTKDRLILVSIILAAAKTCGFSAGLVTGRSLSGEEICIIWPCGIFVSMEKYFALKHQQWKNLYESEVDKCGYD